MKFFTVYDDKYDNNSGEIISSGACPDGDVKLQASKFGTSVVEGKANRNTQKVVDGEIVDKTPKEIEAEKPPKSKPIPIEKQLACIINKQWQDVLDRLRIIENKK